MHGKATQAMSLKKSVVDHTYRDYSRVAISDLVEDCKGVNKEIFPSKLHMILSTPEYALIIAWKPHGRAWYVVNKSRFSSVVLPTHFNHSNFASFNRSVNAWGFKRLLREGPDQNAYYHELFLRGRPELTSAITRLINPGKRLPHKDGEPHFNDISKKYPLPDSPAPLPSEAEEADIRNERNTSTLFTPPPAAKRFRLFISPGTHPYHGYHPYARTPYSEPLPYSQPPPYPQPLSCSQHPSYAQHPPRHQNYFPLPNGTHHSTPVHFYHPHPHPHTATSPKFPPTHPFRHPNPRGPANMHPCEWYPPSPQHHYYSCPPARDLFAQHPEGHNPERMLPIQYSNQQSGYSNTVHPGHNVATGEVHEIDVIQNAAQNISTHVQDQAWRTDSPLVDGVPSSYVEGFELRSATMKTWQYSEQSPFDENALNPHVVPGADERGHDARVEQNPLDIDNFYDSPTKAYGKGWDTNPSQKKYEDAGEGGSTKAYGMGWDTNPSQKRHEDAGEDGSP